MPSTKVQQPTLTEQLIERLMGIRDIYCIEVVESFNEESDESRCTPFPVEDNMIFVLVKQPGGIDSIQITLKANRGKSVIRKVNRAWEAIQSSQDSVIH